MLIFTVPISPSVTTSHMQSRDGRDHSAAISSVMPASTLQDPRTAFLWNTGTKHQPRGVSVRPAHSVHDPSYTGGTLRGSITYSARARIAAVTPVPHEQTMGAVMSTPAWLKADLKSSSPLYLKQT